AFIAASLVAFVPGLPQLGVAARPHAAGLVRRLKADGVAPRDTTPTWRGAAPARAAGRTIPALPHRLATSSPPDTSRAHCRWRRSGSSASSSSPDERQGC